MNRADGVNYDLGTAGAASPFNRNRFHYNGNGTDYATGIGNQA